MTDLAPVTTNDNGTEPVPRLALNRQEAARAMGVGILMVDALIAGRCGNGFPVCYVGSKPVVPVRELQEWLTEQVGEEGRR